MHISNIVLHRDQASGQESVNEGAFRILVPNWGGSCISLDPAPQVIQIPNFFVSSLHHVTYN
jgi:hypothetical protein